MTIGYKNVAILSKVSGLPADEVVNQWYTDTVLSVVPVWTALANFYGSLSSYISPSMGNSLTVNQYAIPDTRPPPGIGLGPPIATHTDVAITGTGSGLPAQIACVLSFHANLSGIPEHAPGPTRPRATRRGRVYLGELNTASLEFETTGAKEVEFNPAFLTNVANSAGVLLHTASLGWSVFSEKNWALYPVIAGWVDDSPDTTRRRKVQADSRTPFS